MGRYMRKCKGEVREITVVEVADHSSGACDDDMKTRSNAPEDESSSSPPASHEKKNKRTWTEGDGESSFDSANSNEFRNTRRRLAIESGTTSCQLPTIQSSDDTFFSEPQPASCCSSNVSGEVVEDRVGAADPTQVEGDSAEVGTLTYSDGRSESERTLLRSRTAESGAAPPPEESHNQENSTDRRLTEVNSGAAEPTTANDEMPSEAEIEEFFSSAENDLQKCFTDKYNFDVVNEVPLGGRYDWVRIKP